ncbi:hypothetical protein D8674_029522 [Pyrus ussuriensis x Pyrus communis]|uniref:Integrase catalytic domain-containing protein n=1 Tax=Pyrus ussuriensis x Pyrus communis TaxID=2448454 RepID=A0A5N5HZA2_9ROSA|nr:hypothetical protein D8674_029522 [Pyrus ussuriensis x Pyrus communis]
MATSVPSSGLSIASFLKLDEDNYHEWLRQMKPFLIGQGLYKFVDGSHPKPSATILAVPPTPPSPTDAPAATVPIPNPALLTWIQQDQLVVSYITTTMTKPIISLTIGCETAQAIWNVFITTFPKPLLLAPHPSIKHIADSLAAINKPVDPEYLVTLTLRGLGPEYLMLRTAILQSSSLPTFTELRSRILAFEAQDPNFTASSPSSHAFFNNHLPPLAPQNPAPPQQFPGHKPHHPKGFHRNHTGRGGNYRNNRISNRRYNNNHGFPLPPTQGQQPWLPRPPPWSASTNGLLGPPPTCCSNCNTNQHNQAHCLHRYTSPAQFPPFAGAHMAQSAAAADPVWYPDTGATHHMTGPGTSLQNSYPYNGNQHVFMGNGDSLNVTHTGTLPFSLGSSTFTLRDVFRIPAIRKNLLSVAHFTKDNRVFFLFAPDFYQIYDLLTGALLFQGPCEDGLYPLQLSSIRQPLAPHALSTLHSSTWHRRLGHSSSSVLSHLGPLLGKEIKFHKTFCTDCAISKSTQLPFSNRNISVSCSFHLIHSDVWMSPVPSISGFQYYVLFTDDFSRYSWIYPMRRKSEMFTHFQTFVAMAQNLFNSSIKILQSDNGTKYVNNAFANFCTTLGIQQRFSCPHTPQQNGVAERKHRHIADMIRTLLHTAHLPSSYWTEAALTAVHLINLLPTPLLNWESLYAKLFHRSPSYSHLRVFGCSCFPNLSPYTSHKLSPRSLECVFIGYNPSHKGYRCLHPSTGRVYISRHVIFQEDYFPFTNLQVTHESPTVLLDIQPIAPPQPLLPSPHIPLSSPPPQVTSPPSDLPSSPPNSRAPATASIAAPQTSPTTPLPPQASCDDAPIAPPIVSPHATHADPMVPSHASPMAHEPPVTTAPSMHPMVTRL